MHKKLIQIDLDGVLNNYCGNYDAEKIVDVKIGAKEFLEELSIQSISCSGISSFKSKLGRDFIESIIEELIKDFKCLLLRHAISLCTCFKLLNKVIVILFKVSDCLFGTTTLHLQNLISFRPFQPTNVNCNCLNLFLIHNTSIRLFKILSIRH